MPYRYREIAKKLKKSGYTILRSGKGSHVIFGKSERRIVVPNHKGRDVSPRVERQICKLLGISKEEFKAL